jgi:hypothetical protein
MDQERMYRPRLVRGWRQLVRELKQGGKMINQLIDELYCGESPYVHADLKNVDHSYPHTNITAELITQIIEKVQPTVWIEIGSMVGKSAILTSLTAKTLGKELEIICLDPWCGDVNAWSWNKSNQTWLKMVRGRPSIYERFLANVVAAGLQDSILPISCTGLIGLGLLSRLHCEKRINELPTVVYIDSSHEEDETFGEIQAARRLIANGVIFGDDYDWTSVASAVNKAFCGHCDIIGNHWMVHI